jgi:hypothetical protein
MLEVGIISFCEHFQVERVGRKKKHTMIVMHNWIKIEVNLSMSYISLIR